jgi:hypothetical protein
MLSRWLHQRFDTRHRYLVYIPVHIFITWTLASGACCFTSTRSSPPVQHLHRLLRTALWVIKRGFYTGSTDCVWFTGFDGHEAQQPSIYDNEEDYRLLEGRPEGGRETWGTNGRTTDSRITGYDHGHGLAAVDSRSHHYLGVGVDVVFGTGSSGLGLGFTRRKASAWAGVDLTYWIAALLSIALASF